MPESPDECLKPKPRPPGYWQHTPGNELLPGAGRRVGKILLVN